MQYIHCAKGTVALTSSKGQRFEVEVAVTTTIRLVAFLVDEKLWVTTSVWLEIFRMSFQRSYQGCHHIGKLSLSLIPYLGCPYFQTAIQDVCRRVKGTEEAVNRITRGWVHSSEFLTLWSADSNCTEERRITRDVRGL